jgi:hypothetical protein
MLMAGPCSASGRLLPLPVGLQVVAVGDLKCD